MTCRDVNRRLNGRQVRKCGTCGKHYEAFNSAISRLGGRYCSRACYFAELGKQRAIIDATCNNCGKQIRRTRVHLQRVKRVFCGPACVASANRGAGSPMFRGARDDKRGAKWLARAERIRKRDGYCCRRCGKSQAENGRRLCVDHIIPWRVFSDAEKHLANADNNLASLCTSCHSWKTSRAEHKWLRGDVLDFKRYEQALALPSAVRTLA